MGDEKNPEKDFDKEKNRKGTIKSDENNAITEEKEEKRDCRIFIYTSDFIGSDWSRCVSFDSVKESSKP